MPDWPWRVLVAGPLIAAVVTVSLVAADKVDVVHLKNGDRITCEIKRLDRGVLSISTDPLGAVSVYWGEVAGVESPREFELQMSSGEQYQGALLTAPPNQVLLSTAGAPIALVLSDVIRLTPIGSTLWHRVDGALDAGFSFVQANHETHLTANGDVRYRGPRYQSAAGYASNVTTRDDADRVFRSNLNLSGNRFLDHRWYTGAWGAMEQNDELSLDLRLVGAAGVGRDVVHTNHRLWSVFTGLAYTHEQYTDQPSDQSIEATMGTQLDFFTPYNNDINLTNRVVSYIRLGGRARIRVELQSAWQHEFFKDFYWSLNGFDSFDADPPADQKKNDFGISFTLGVKF